MGRDDDLLDLRGSPAAETEALTRAIAHAEVERFTLLVTSGPDAGATYVSQGDSVTVGTHATAHFRLSDRALSRFHFEISIEKGVALIRDLGSRNGTHIGNVEVAVAPLQAGSTLAAGRSSIRFDLTGDSVSVPLSSKNHFGLAVGRSASMRSVFAVLERVASSDSPVLLQGETGTGKEVIAESIHVESSRSQGPFVVVDCGALPRALIESELFGHVRGAFTGAEADRRGAFELAHGGTLFLDEIGELDESVQPRLLGVLERRQVQPVGTNERRPIDVRVIAATNRNLRRAVNAKQFRSDLYFRLAVVEVRLPPLRERLEDISLLVERMLDNSGASDLERELVTADEFIDFLKGQSWAGNIRELRNAVERAMLLGSTNEALLRKEQSRWDLPTIDIAVPIREARKSWVLTFERRYLEALLEAHSGNVSASARACGLDRMHLYRLLRRAGLR